MTPCLNCGRSFAADRLQKHQRACKKVSKPRKVFNIAAQRIAGSGAEEFVGKRKPKAAPKKVRTKE